MTERMTPMMSSATSPFEISFDRAWSVVGVNPKKQKYVNKSIFILATFIMVVAKHFALLSRY